MSAWKAFAQRNPQRSLEEWIEFHEKHEHRFRWMDDVDFSSIAKTSTEEERLALVKFLYKEGEDPTGKVWRSFSQTHTSRSLGSWVEMSGALGSVISKLKSSDL